MTTKINNEHKKVYVPNSTDRGNVIRNVPHLRFPEFEGEWEDFLINDVCSEFKSGKNIKADSISESGEYPVYGGNGLRGYTSSYNHEGLYVLIGRQGALCGNVRSVHGKTFITEHAIAVAGNEISNTSFLLYLFVKMNLGQYSDQSAQPGLAVNKLLKIKVVLPSVSEQTKIARFLSLLDERITTQNKIIEDLKKLKCAIIEKVYSEIQGKEYSYGQLFDVINERNKQMEYSNILSASQEKGMVNRDDLNLDIQFERSNINTYKIVRKGDYVIHLRSFQGGFAFSDKLGVCSPAYTILRPNSLLEYGYLSNYFTSQRFIKSLVLVTYGIRDGRSINVDEWLRMKITIPPKEHQQYIVKVIGTFERKIEDEEAYAAQLSIQKQYLLRQMFI